MSSAELLRVLAGIALLVVATAAVLRTFGVRFPWAPAGAVARGALQLAAISLVLTGVITSRLWVSAALLVMFSVAALLTQIMSDAATTVLLGPIAISLAQSLGLPPTPFVVCTALGAVVAFLTPIGHHGNLLILGPGQYRFGDFLRIGLPLTLLIGLLCAWMARWLWLGGPLLLAG